jgi:putative ABC transport system permease protein
MAIRKIFGASNPNIIYQMQKEFFIYIGLAALIAVPFSWYMMNLWLNEFYYRVTLHWFTFAISVATIAGFVSLILLLRTMKLIRENPINALKYE